jgi:tetratricopeptide (TPR) repeat protein
VLYEQPLCDALVGAIRRIDGILYRSIGGGARSKDPDWCLGDVELLAAEVRRDPSNARNVFYLGRTYEGAGDPVRALAQYERRALMGGAPEELYCAVFNAARVREELCFPRARVEAGYLEAWMLRPWRAEPLHRLAVVAREAGDLSRARALAGAAQAIPFPRDEVLTVNREVYLWRALDELAAACTKLGNLDAAIDACKQMLARPLPPEEKARIHANVAACQAGKGG